MALRIRLLKVSEEGTGWLTNYEGVVIRIERPTSNLVLSLNVMDLDPLLSTMVAFEWPLAYFLKLFDNFHSLNNYYAVK